VRLGKLSRAPAAIAAAPPPTAQPAATAPPPPPPTGAAQLIFLKDSKSHSKYLVDTGAALSLLPFKSSQPSSGPKLCNANGKPISSWKFVEKTLQFGKHTFKHLFLQADVSQAIIGLDFLHANSITIDAKKSPSTFSRCFPSQSPFSHASFPSHCSPSRLLSFHSCA
jgi:hypothetical protein